MIYVVSVSEAAYQAKNLLELKAADWQSVTGVMAHIAMVSALRSFPKETSWVSVMGKKGCVESFCVWASLNIQVVVSTQRSSEILFRAYTSYFFSSLTFSATLGVARLPDMLGGSSPQKLPLVIPLAAAARKMMSLLRWLWMLGLHGYLGWNWMNISAWAVSMQGVVVQKVARLAW